MNKVAERIEKLETELVNQQERFYLNKIKATTLAKRTAEIQAEIEELKAL